MMYFYYRFSLFYDDDKSCKKFLKGFFIDYIMFFFLDYKISFWIWFYCSFEFIIRFIE